MNDYMMLEFLRNKESRKHPMIDEFERYMRARGKMTGRGKRNRDYDYDMKYNRHDWEDYDDMYNTRYSKGSEGSFDEHEAKEIVSEMHHYESDRKHKGEHFDMKKAEEVYSKYKEHFVTEASPEDVYIAINATYHDFCKLLKSWFGSNIDEKIIMLAITFWFKDDDYQGNKLLDYFE